MDEITLTGLRVFGHHGVFDHERRDGQDFVIDFTLRLDTHWAAESDDVAENRALWRGGAARRRDRLGDPVDLIETLAARMRRRCWSSRVPGVRVTVRKPDAPIPLRSQMSRSPSSASG